MSYTKYPVPSHDPQGLQTGSRLFSVLQEAAPIAVLVAIQGFSNQGLVNHQVPVETVETPPSKIVSLPPVSGVSLVTLEASVAGTGSVTADLTVTIGPKRSVAIQGYSNQGGVTRAPIPAEVEQVELGSRDFRRDGQSQQLATSIAGQGAVASDLTVQGAPPAFSVLVQGHTNQGRITRQVVQPQVELREDTSRTYFASHMYQQLAVSIAGQGAVAADLTVTSAATGVRLGVAVPGRTNQGFSTTGVPQEPLEDAAFNSRNFLYYNSAPPIYRVIVPGSTNQHFTAQQYKATQWEDALLGSRIYRRQSGVLRDLAVSIAGTGAVSPDLTVQGAPAAVRLGVALAGFTNQGYTTRAVPVIDRAQVELGTRWFRSRALRDLQVSIAGQGTITPTLSSIGGGARQRTLLGVGE